jgi:hypothetical protein
MNFNENPPESLEKKERTDILEESRQERVAILGQLSERLIRFTEEQVAKVPKPMQHRISDALNFLPGISNLKLLLEGVKGVTISGEALSNRDRMAYLISVTLAVISYCLFLRGAINKDLSDVGLSALFNTTASGVFYANLVPGSLRRVRDLAVSLKEFEAEEYLRVAEVILSPMAQNNIK